MASVLFGGAAEPPPPHIEPLLTLLLSRKSQRGDEANLVEYTNVLRGVFPTFCLDVLCKRGFALGCRREDCLGFISRAFEALGWR